jgi:hypothetical protein
MKREKLEILLFQIDRLGGRIRYPETLPKTHHRLYLLGDKDLEICLKLDRHQWLHKEPRHPQILIQFWLMFCKYFKVKLEVPWLLSKHPQHSHPHRMLHHLSPKPKLDLPGTHGTASIPYATSGLLEGNATGVITASIFTVMIRACLLPQILQIITLYATLWVMLNLAMLMGARPADTGWKMIANTATKIAGGGMVLDQPKSRLVQLLKMKLAGR